MCIRDSSQAQSGSQAAWEELYRRYRALLTVMVHVRIPSLFRGRFDTEDVLQSAFLSAYDQIEEFDYNGEGSFRGWLTTLVVNKLRDLLRFHQSDRRSLAKEAGGLRGRESDEALDPAAFAAVNHQDPAQVMEQVERHASLLSAMRDLEERDQDLICMRVFEHMTWGEIAGVLEISNSTARKRYATAVERLTQLLK